ncbi:aminoglycoside phosphotransferase family protein [Sphingobium sp.]|uniref:phosphotransferase family protein n=1 Tax=Sphingobium sp. TaxID=1912891 RepID=UPI002C1AD74B|nr:aminoglycoside phosphotransferase family protein [Sphingobium sp.]HUD90415.1 aminoglycoside phosphotransferase family protein [Sphingobium sp.]
MTLPDPSSFPDPASFIAAGQSAEVYRLDGGRVIKLFHAGVDTAIIAREHGIGRVVQASGLPVPRVFGLDEAGERQGIIYSELSGPNLLAYIARHPHRTGWALGQMAQLQQHIQACHTPSLRSRKAIILEDIEAAPIGERLRAAAIDRLEQLNEGDRLTHGDLHPGNLIVTPDGVSVIDWSRAACGTIATDLVRTEMLMRFGPGRAGQDVGWIEAAMRDVASCWYLRRYRAGTGLDAEALTAWRPLVALAWMRQRAPVREAAFAAYLAEALRVAGLPPID